jgi:hypothetical protein
MADEGRKEYFEKKPGYVVKSGTEQAQTGKITDYAVYTDNGQGLAWTTDGEHRSLTNKTSYDLSGIDPEMSSGVPAKVIRTKKGDIIIDAMDGDIIIRGNNVRLVATDGAGEVTITSAKQFAVNAPIQNLKGTNFNTVMSNNVSIGAQSVDTTGNMQNTSNAGGEEGQSSILSRILGVVKKFGAFFE